MREEDFLCEDRQVNVVVDLRAAADVVTKLPAAKASTLEAIAQGKLITDHAVFLLQGNRMGWVTIQYNAVPLFLLHCTYIIEWELLDGCKELLEGEVGDCGCLQTPYGVRTDDLGSEETEVNDLKAVLNQRW